MAQILEHFQAKHALGLDPGVEPVRVEEMRPNYNLESFCESHSVRTALEDCLAALTLSAFLGTLLFWSALAQATLAG